MKPTKNISQKLKSYSALAGSFIVAGSAADAQIVYTNITDYTGTMNGDTYQLDLNNDSNNDFDITLNIFASTKSTINWVNAKGLGYNLLESNNTGGASALILNSNIGATNTWANGSNSGGLLMAFGNNSFALGPWVGATDKYLGLKLIKNSQTYYGWARLDVNSLANVFTIKDYAYEMTADKTIKAGDMGTTTSIAESKELSVTVYSSEKTITVKQNGDADLTGAVVSVKNVLGQEVRTATLDGKTTVIDMSGAPSGIYFTTVTKGEKSFTGKVYIQ